MVLSNIETAVHSESATTARPANVTNGHAASTDAEQKVARAIGLMRGCLNQSLAVNQLARMANISPSHFFAVFKKQTGFAPLDYFIRLRMQRACELLDATELAVKEVANELGYEDPYYFSRLFKSVSQVAPTEYRRLDNNRKKTLRQRVFADDQDGATCEK